MAPSLGWRFCKGCENIVKVPDHDSRNTVFVLMLSWVQHCANDTCSNLDVSPYQGYQAGTSLTCLLACWAFEGGEARSLSPALAGYASVRDKSNAQAVTLV